jgi:hypothetical protein
MIAAANNAARAQRPAQATGAVVDHETSSEHCRRQLTVLQHLMNFGKILRYFQQSQRNFDVAHPSQPVKHY